MRGLSTGQAATPCGAARAGHRDRQPRRGRHRRSLGLRRLDRGKGAVVLCHGDGLPRIPRKNRRVRQGGSSLPAMATERGAADAAVGVVRSAIRSFAARRCENDVSTDIALMRDRAEAFCGGRASMAIMNNGRQTYGSPGLSERRTDHRRRSAGCCAPPRVRGNAACRKYLKGWREGHYWRCSALRSTRHGERFA